MNIDKLENADCIEFMKSMDKNSVDFTLTDIPYDSVDKNLGTVGTLSQLSYKGVADKKTFELEPFLENVDRITKNSIVIFCGIEQLGTIFTYFRSKKYPTRQLVWQKTNPVPVNGDKEYLSGIENAVWCKKNGAKFNGFCVPNVLSYPIQKKDFHPTEKNHEMLRQLIRENSLNGELVFDPCAGSASTLIVAGQEGRHYLGCELNQDFYKKAVNRLSLCGGFQSQLFA